MNLDTLNRGELIAEISDLAREQGVTDQSGWNELVDEVLDSHLDLAELNADADLEGLKQALALGWEEYRREAGQETNRAMDEDPETPKA